MYIFIAHAIRSIEHTQHTLLTTHNTILTYARSASGQKCSFVLTICVTNFLDLDDSGAELCRELEGIELNSVVVTSEV